MKNLFFALFVIGLVVFYLWHFNPSSIKGNLEEKTHRRLPGKAPLVYRCSLQRTFYLLGPQRRKHSLLTPEEVALKHILASVLNDSEALRETLSPAKAQNYCERKLTRKERRRLKKLIAKDCVYTAMIENLSSNCATVHVVGQIGDQKQSEQWCLLACTTDGWVVDELSNQDF